MQELCLCSGEWGVGGGSEWGGGGGSKVGGGEERRFRL